MVKKEKEEKKSSKGDGEDKELKDKVAEETLIGKGEKKKSDKEQAAKEKTQEKAKESEEEMIKKLQEEIDRLTTKDIITQMMMSLSSLAYKKMGIPAGVNDKFKDKQQAKLAVDSFDALLKIIMEEVSAEEKENLKASLSNLQLNFVKNFP